MIISNLGFLGQGRGWNLDNVVYSTNSKSVSTQDNIANDCFFSSDGLNMYIVGTQNDTVYQYTVSTAWDLGSTVTYASKSKDVTSQTTNAFGLFFDTTGEIMYIADRAGHIIYQYTISTAWDLGSTVTYASKSFDTTSEEFLPSGLFFNPNGKQMYVVGNASDTVYEYSL